MGTERETVVIVASEEFVLKSYPVRRTLEQRLTDDLRVAVARAGFEGCWVEKHAARLVIQGISESAAEQVAACCSKVFGVAYSVPATQLPPIMETVLNEIVRIAQTSLKPGQSFAVRCHRSVANDLDRREVEIQGGARILESMKTGNVRVNLKDPDVTIGVDVAGDRVFVYGNKTLGPGGLPLSAQWMMLAVLDSGPLTILAAYAMMRRGCMVQLLIPISENISFFKRDRQLEVASKLRRLVTRPAYKAFTVNIGLVDGLRASDYVTARRLLRYVAPYIAHQKKFRGLVLSDTSGDLSQLSELNPSDGGMSVPIFHPLIGLDAEELIEMCGHIGFSEDDLMSQIRLEREVHAGLAAATSSENQGELAVEEIAL